MAGSIEKRGKNSYRLSCLAGYNLQGKPIKKTKTVHGTKKEAEIEQMKFLIPPNKNNTFDTIKNKPKLIQNISSYLTPSEQVDLSKTCRLLWLSVFYKTKIDLIQKQFMIEKYGDVPFYKFNQKYINMVEEIPEEIVEEYEEPTFNKEYEPSLVKVVGQIHHYIQLKAYKLMPA